MIDSKGRAHFPWVSKVGSKQGDGQESKEGKEQDQRYDPQCSALPEFWDEEEANVAPNAEPN